MVRHFKNFAAFAARFLSVLAHIETLCIKWLSVFKPIINFDSPKNQKTYGFLIIS